MASPVFSPPKSLSPNMTLQRPLSRCGRGPGLVLLRPASHAPCNDQNTGLDPAPLQKWAEESYAVVQITLDESQSLRERVDQAVAELRSLPECDQEKLGLLGMPLFALDVVPCMTDQSSLRLQRGIPSLFCVCAAPNHPLLRSRSLVRRPRHSRHPRSSTPGTTHRPAPNPANQSLLLPRGLVAAVHPPGPWRLHRRGGRRRALALSRLRQEASGRAVFRPREDLGRAHVLRVRGAVGRKDHGDDGAGAVCESYNNSQSAVVTFPKTPTACRVLMRDS